MVTFYLATSNVLNWKKMKKSYIFFWSDKGRRKKRYYISYQNNIVHVDFQRPFQKCLSSPAQFVLESIYRTERSSSVDNAIRDTFVLLLRYLHGVRFR